VHFVRQQIKGTIWEKLDEQDIAQMLDLSMLEETFGLKSGKKVGGDSKPKSTAKPKVQLVQVLEGKKGENIDIAIRSSKVRYPARSTTLPPTIPLPLPRWWNYPNLAIYIRRFANSMLKQSALCDHARLHALLLDFQLKDSGQKVSHKDIRKSVLSADDRLPVNLLEGLLNNAPTSDETTQLQAYKATPDKVGTAERLFLSLADVPRLAPRLRAMMFRAEFKEKMDFVKPGMRNVIIASQDVCVSKGLFKTLQVTTSTFLSARFCPRGLGFFPFSPFFNTSVRGSLLWPRFCSATTSLCCLLVTT